MDLLVGIFFFFFEEQRDEMLMLLVSFCLFINGKIS